MARPLALPVNPANQSDYNRKVANALNIARNGLLPVGVAVPYNGTSAPEGYTTASPGPSLSAGWIWITPVD